jgi:hypothetical protein
MEQPYGAPDNGHYNLALWSLICGIASLVICCCGSPLGVVAVVLGIMSINAENRAGHVERSGKTMAIIGIVLGGLACMGLVLSILSSIMGSSIPHFGPRPPFRFPGMPSV